MVFYILATLSEKAYCRQMHRLKTYFKLKCRDTESVKIVLWLYNLLIPNIDHDTFLREPYGRNVIDMRIPHQLETVVFFPKYQQYYNFKIYNKFLINFLIMYNCCNEIKSLVFKLCKDKHFCLKHKY